MYDYAILAWDKLNYGIVPSFKYNVAFVLYLYVRKLLLLLHVVFVLFCNKRTIVYLQFRLKSVRNYCGGLDCI